MQSTTLEKLGHVLASDHDAIVVGDRAGIIEWASGAWSEITGYSLAASIAKPINDVLLEAGIDSELVDFVAGQFTSGAVSRLEFPLTRPDGATVWLHLDVRPLLDDDGEPSHFVACARDVTALKTGERVHAAKRARRRFAANGDDSPGLDPVALAERLCALAQSLAGPRTAVEFEVERAAGPELRERAETSRDGLRAAHARGSVGAVEAHLVAVIHHMLDSIDDASWAHLQIAAGRVRRRVAENEWRDEGRAFLEISHDGPNLARAELAAIGRLPPRGAETPCGLALSRLRGIVASQGNRFRVRSAPGIGTQVRIEWPTAGR